MKKQVVLKAILQDKWVAEHWRLHPPCEFATFDIPGTRKAEIPDEIASPFVEYARYLGYEPSQLASHHIALAANGIAKRKLGQSPSFAP